MVEIMQVQPPTQTYVCGFMFDVFLQQVALILKNRGPSHINERLNGVGGKIEVGEGIRTAMAREFQEEAGVFTNPEQWTCFHTEQYIGNRSKVHFMCTMSDRINYCRSMESEQVMLFNIRPNGQLVNKLMPITHNLNYLIPMAMSWLNNPDFRYFES